MLEDTLREMKKASAYIANASTELKNKALQKIAENLDKNRLEIIKQNEIDLKTAEAGHLAIPLLKRLKFDDSKLNVVIQGVNDLVNLEDPSNKILSKMLIDDGLTLTQISVPIGVIGVIFESRPDALVQIATLGIKSGNAVVLKGGREALNTNKILTKIITESIEETSDIFKNTIALIETRDDVNILLEQNKYINLIIPRGSNEFVQYIQKNSLIPVLGHADGICHSYVDEYADLDKAVKVIVDSKTQYVAVCNAMETLLVNEKIAEKALPILIEALREKGVIVKGDSKVAKIIPDVENATEDDWKTEYLDYILSIKVVADIDEAIDHINTYGSGHTDAIITENEDNKKKFQAYVDTSSVMVNCSTRFADGFRYGKGAEVGVSTNKIHARGPVGLEGLVIYKYLLEGNGHIVDDYREGGPRTYKHKKMDI